MIQFKLLLIIIDEDHVKSSPSLPATCLASPLVALFPKLSHDAVFTVCSHILTLFWSRKTSVMIKTIQLSFRVFVCAFCLEICSFSRQEFPLSFPIFLGALLIFEEKNIYLGWDLNSWISYFQCKCIPSMENRWCKFQILV